MKNQEKFKNLMQDEEFVTSLLEMQTPEEVQEEFKKHDIEMSLDEVGQLGSAINYMIKEEKTELTEDDLAKIGGGLTEENKKDFQKGFFGEAGKQALLFVGIPIIVGGSVLAKWGFEKLTKKIDKKLDAPKVKKS